MRQQMRISPQMKQAFEMLQMPLQELMARVGEEAATNPVIEGVVHPREEYLADHRKAFDSAERGETFADGPGNDAPSEAMAAPDDIRSLANADPAATAEFFRDGDSGEWTEDDAERRQFFFDTQTSHESLGEHLRAQLSLFALPPLDRALAEEVVGSLDDRGYLTTPLADIALAHGATLGDAERALRTVQTLDPPGIGARDLAECLLLQLAANGMDDVLAAQMLREQPALVARRDVPALARALHCGTEDVRFAFDDLRALSPAPGAAFAHAEPDVIVPEATVVLRNGRYVVLERQLDGPEARRENPLPRLLIRKAYRERAANDATPPEERRYLRNMLSRADQIQEALEQRRETTLAVAEAIVDRQQDFFDQGVSALRPMTMGDIAAALGVHESTVSRAVAGKWMKTPRGPLEFRSFFTTGLKTDGDGAAVSNKAVQERIRALVHAENPAAPLSDAAIAKALASEGITVARRTVAKYRDILRIPSTSERKRR